MDKLFILFARRDANAPWMRLLTTARTTKPVTLKVARAKGREWLNTGWMVRILNTETQEAQELK